MWSLESTVERVNEASFASMGGIRAIRRKGSFPFAITLTDRSFDAAEYPHLRFMIRPDGPDMNLFVRQGKDWSEVSLFDLEDPGDTENSQRHEETRTGIAQLGSVTPAPTDQEGWALVKMNLAQLLARKGKPSRVDEIVLAAVDCKGYRRLAATPGRGSNRVDLDDLAIYSEGEANFTGRISSTSPNTTGFLCSMSNDDGSVYEDFNVPPVGANGEISLQGLSGNKILTIVEVVNDNGVIRHGPLGVLYV